MIKPWIKAFRLRTLPLAISGWLVGISLTYADTAVDSSIAALTLLTAVLLQILSNLANDYGDAASGVDELRKGETRMVSSGAISASAMKRAIFLFAGLALISGLLLLSIAFPNDFRSALLFFAIGIVGIVAAIKYTIGKNPYGYAGFGDVFVFAFFGLVLVFGTYFLQTNRIDWFVLLPATSLGLFSVGVLNVNNIRDIESDKKAGKQSIPVRIGRRKAIIYHAFLLTLGLLASVVYVVLNFQTWFNLIFIIIVPLFVKNISAVASKRSEELDPYLKQMAISTMLFSILFSMGQFLVGIF